MSDKGITLEGLAAAVDAIRQELATWKALAHKQDQLSADQITATQSGATAAKISQIAVNTAAIQSLAAQVAGQISLAYVTTLPATGEPLTLYLVPQGDGTAPNFCNEYLWINNAWELIGTTGAMANNGELTIQVNGAAVGTFTANQATNAAINVTVPTNTNQLVNGAGYVDTAALQAALALKQNSLNATQLAAVNSGITAAGVQQIADNATAIAGKQDALTTAQRAAVDSGATAAKIDQIASNASAIVSLTSSKQDALSTTQLAAVNSGVTASAVQQIGTNADNISGLQTAVASKAADDQVVHLAGAETITGDKTFSGAVTLDGWPLATGYQQVKTTISTDVAPSSTQYFGYNYANNNDGKTLLHHRAFISANTLNNTLRYWVHPNTSTDGNNGGFQIVAYGDGTTVATFKPRGNVEPYDPNYGANLGSSSLKWRSLNGLSPGDLGRVKETDYVSIDTTNWSLSSANHLYINGANPTYPGWLYVRINNATTSDKLYARIGGTSTSLPGVVAAYMDGGYFMLFCPVAAGQTINVYTTIAPSVCRYYPCLGNV